jgi:ADP-heptose:LPS heptosyltransferase
LSGAPCRLVLYGGKWASVTLHERVPPQLAESSGHYARQVLSLGGLLGARTDDSRPEIFLRESELSQMRQALREHFGESFRPLIVLHAGGGHLRATQRSSASNLTVAEYARLTGLLLEATDCRIVITGGTDETGLLEPFWTPWRRHPRCWFAVGSLALRPLTALLHLSDLTVVGSTGPLHLASAVGATTLTPFSQDPGVNAATWGNQGGVGHVIACPPLGHASATGNYPDTLNADHFFARAREILRDAKVRADSPAS